MLVYEQAMSSRAFVSRRDTTVIMTEDIEVPNQPRTVLFWKPEYTFPSDELRPLRDSSDVVGDAMRERPAEDGFLYLPGFLDREEVLAARREILAYMARQGGLARLAHDDTLAITDRDVLGYADRPSRARESGRVGKGIARAIIVHTSKLSGAALTCHGTHRRNIWIATKVPRSPRRWGEICTRNLRFWLDGPTSGLYSISQSICQR